MLNKFDAHIPSSMDSPTEDEALDLDGEDIDDDYDDNDDIVVLDNFPPNLDLDISVENEIVPLEINAYMTSIESQTKRLEQELEECDDLLRFDPHSSNPSTEKDTTVMVYDDLQELKEAAAEAGMTVEEMKAKLLKDIDDDDFTEDMMDMEYQEITALRTDLADTRQEIDKLNDDLDMEVNAFLDTRAKRLQGLALAIEDGDESSSKQDGEMAQDEDDKRMEASHKLDPTQVSTDVQQHASMTQQPTTVALEENSNGAGPVVIAAEFTDFREFIRTQLRKTESQAQEHRQQLRKMFDVQHQKEEEKLLKDEKYKRDFELHQEREAGVLRERKREEEERVEEEIRHNHKLMEEEYERFEVNLSQLDAAYKEEKKTFEKMKELMGEEWRDRRNKAATHIQRVFKGYRTRCVMRAAIIDLAETKELRRKEKEKIRVMEVQYEMDLKAEKEKRDKEQKEEEEKKEEEDLKQQEKDRQKKDEADRLKEQILMRQEEDERKKKEEDEKKRKEEELAKKEEDEKKRKEEELAKKEEEKKRKEEERRQKEEDKKREKEEKRLNKEEEKRKKEEEKQKKEEEKRKREEAKRKEEEEEKRRNEEDKLKAEEERGIQKVEEEEKADKEELVEDRKGAMETVSSVKCETTVVCEAPAGQAGNGLSSGQDHVETNRNHNSSKNKTKPASPGFPQQDSLEEDTTNVSDCPVNTTNVSDSSGMLSPHPPSGDPGSTVTRHRPVIPIKQPPPEHSVPSDAPIPLEHSVPSDVPMPLEHSKPELIAHDRVHVPVKNGSPPPIAQCPYEPPPPVIDPYEPLRLKWMKQATHWSQVSNEPWKLRHAATGKMTRKPKTSPIPEQLVLTSAHAESLRQVSCVTFQDLPGHSSLSTLSQCWNLVHLTVSHTGLGCLDGLAACKHLLYIHAADNAIEFMDVRDLGSLQYLNVSRNKLASIHGLQGCVNLRWLDLGHNAIGMIDQLSSLRRLHTLNLSHNHVSSCQGLELAPTLQDVDLSHNFIQTVTDVDKLCLLTSLSLASNNLLQPPVLTNHVLLKWLLIQENSIQSLAPLGLCWLPVLHHLNVGSNRLEKLNGLESLPSLSTLDVCDNQILDLDSVTPWLKPCDLLTSLTLAGNPFQDEYDSEYRNLVKDALPRLEVLDGESLREKRRLSDTVDVSGSLRVFYMHQIGMCRRLKEGFESQAMKVETPPAYDPQVLCTTTFHYCDTSFKMAVEHRSSHEYGDFPSPSSDDVIATVSSSPLVNGSTTGAATSRGSRDSIISDVPGMQTATRDQDNNSTKPPSTLHVTDLNNRHQSNMSKEGSTPRKTNAAISNDSVLKGSDLPYPKSHHVSSSLSTNRITSGRGHTDLKDVHGDGSCVYNGNDDDSDNDDTDDSGDLMDVTKQDSAGGGGGGGTGFEPNSARSKVAASAIPTPSLNYLSEKDKFLMALGGGGGGKGEIIPSDPSGTTTMARAALGQDGSGSKGHTQLGHGHISGVKASVVGAYMGQQGDSEFDGKDTDVADAFDLDCLDFDFDKYLDIGEIDEFLEKGWRPEDSPQIPSSNYPVLGKINPQGSKQLHNLPPSGQHLHQRHHHHQQQQQQQQQQHQSRVFPNPSPPPPPSNPHQAWSNQNNHNHNNNHHHHIIDSNGSGHDGVPPFPLPSPSPSSVASAAETLGGGSVKVRKKEELCEEWGFKDSRTADLMLARARKMKYNSEKKKKLSKLDPQQRYQLFQKLEESGKIQNVRPPPAKVLPRKEYFQAREEEVHRQEFEREQDEKAKVHRTFEWLHTQVGDYQVSSSRIHPSSGPAYSNQEMRLGQPGGSVRPSNSRQGSVQTSPDLDASKMAADGQALSHRRYSLGDGSSTSRSPLLPPIHITSPPAHHHHGNHHNTREKISFRNDPVERSGGWGGGKKRSGK